MPLKSPSTPNVDRSRQELYKTIWGIADDLRGSVDGWDFKNYILGFLFYRYISEDFCRFVKEYAGFPDTFDYSQLRDQDPWIEGHRTQLTQRKGYFIYPRQLFSNALRHLGQGNLNEIIKDIFLSIESTANPKANFRGLLSSVELSDLKLGNDVHQRNKNIFNIMKGIERMNFSVNGDTHDLFGDAYEYLIGMYSSNAGKSGGEFYTPPEVSELIAGITLVRGRSIGTIYDPTCGSGSLLLKFLRVYDRPEDLRFFGQEINLTTCNLCRMNMLLHRLDSETFSIERGDTLTDDKFPHQTFDVIVSNPPYSIKWVGTDNPTLLRDPRFIGAGALAPKRKADMAFIQHSIHHLNLNGIAAIVCFPGILYREGAEKKIRRWLVDQNYIDAIIQLPDNLFYGTSISTCIMVLRNDPNRPQNILFIDGRDRFVKAKSRNRLTEDNIRQILSFYRARKDVENCAKLVSNAEIAEKDHNLSVNTYVSREETPEEIDISRLNRDLKKTALEVNELREEIEKLIKEL